jgi:predicted acetyltransferase
MAITIRPVREDELEKMARADGHAFGHTWQPEELARVLPTMDPGRFRIALDRGDLVGVAGTYEFDMALPGGTSIPTGGVTWVSVALTHRRQGILRRLMDAVHDDVDARGEPLAALTASEGGIYERFGYGVASEQRVVEIERRRGAFRPEFVPAPGSVRLVDGDLTADEVVDAVAERYSRVQPHHPGEITRSREWHRKRLGELGPGGVMILHDDGFAVWTVDADWAHGHPSHTVNLHELTAATPEAHAALWHTVLAIDLVAKIRSWRIPPGDPLPFLLRDRRALRTVELNDGLWLNVRDVAACFGRRSYATDDDVVIEADGGRWRIGAAGCRRVRTRPDLVTDHASLGALLLGGVAPSTLVAGRRMSARNDESLRRADALLLHAPAPYCRTAF